MLLKEFAKNPVWDLSDKIRIGEAVGLTPNQVAKWNYDHRKKLGIDTSRSTQHKDRS